MGFFAELLGGVAGAHRGVHLMSEHMIHSHLEFWFLMGTLGLMLPILAFHAWGCWRAGRRGKPSEFLENLWCRRQTDVEKLKYRPDDQGVAP